MIDLHSHILPGIDDGAPDLGASIAMARRAVEEGISTIAATPHVNGAHNPSPETIDDAVSALRASLGEEGIPLELVPAAEIGLVQATDMEPETLRRLAYGESSCVLIECPYQRSAPFLAEALFAMQLAGLRPLLAHPERSPLFLRDPELLPALAGRGILAAVNSSSLHRGRPGRDFAVEALTGGHAQVICSDAHDDDRRPPSIAAGARAAELGEALTLWASEEVPAALLADAPIPPAPAPPERRRGLFKRR